MTLLTFMEDDDGPSYLEGWIESWKEKQNDSPMVREQLLQQLVQNYDTTEEKEEIIWLELALTFKKRHDNVQLCQLALLQRMKCQPCLWFTDSIRLLNDCATRGIFQMNDEELELSQHYCCCCSSLLLGTQLRQLFQKEEYTYTLICKNYLCPLLPPSTNFYHVYDATVFFQNRHELYQRTDIIMTSSLCVLVRLFLFGLSVTTHDVQTYLSPSTIDLLQQAQLITPISMDDDTTIWVGQVQIYPLDRNLFSSSSLQNHEPLYIMTDWPMESLQPTDTAIMSIGYDSLELVALSIQDDVSNENDDGWRILDVCCGSGIQGISYISTFSSSCQELLFVDLNPRALRFAMANLSFNHTCWNHTTTTTTPCHTVQCRALCGDLFHPIQTTYNKDQSIDNLRFHRILANPPFVATPILDRPAMFAIGGDMDGMKVTREILHQCCDYLQPNVGILFMVTELSNIDDVERHQTLFPPPPTERTSANHQQQSHKLDIAYCIQDVEPIVDYAQERQNEDLFSSENNDWCQQLQDYGIYNRALVLLTFQATNKQTNDVQLHALDRNTIHPPLQEDGDEDAFLTPMGIQFIKDNLLS